MKLTILIITIIAITTWISRDLIPKTITTIKNNYTAIKYLPITLTILITTAIISLKLSQHIQILQIGLLNTNIIGLPLKNTIEQTSQKTKPKTITTIKLTLKYLSFLTLIILAMLINNYLEEKHYRKNYKQVTKWALLHLIMGIPLYAIIPIFSTGIIYKKIYDKKGLPQAFVTHFFTNITLLLIVTIQFTTTTIT